MYVEILFKLIIDLVFFCFRFDEVQDDIDENVMGSITGSITEQPIYSPESLAEQDEILDV